MIDISNAINALHPENSFILRDDDYSQIEWVNAPENPATLEQVNAKLAELQAEYEANQYQRDRASQYPSIQDQLDMQYWDQVNGTTTWKDAVAKVKSDNPKPE
tara:strand:+ start:1318 stop:1626 length:309 start_codon:yes stop_codon:yes gene_type:complete